MQVEIASYCKCFKTLEVFSLKVFLSYVVKVTNFIEIPLAISADALILPLYQDEVMLANECTCEEGQVNMRIKVLVRIKVIIEV